jgi:hypothetical protein
LTKYVKIIYQAKNDGTIEIAEQNKKLTEEQLRLLFESSLDKGSWQLQLVGQELGLLIYNVSVGSLILKLYVYLFNVHSSSRGRTREQRIQLNPSLSRKGFSHTNSKTNKCLVLGVYKRDDAPIICAWNAEKKNNHGKQKSCYIDIETIAIAMRDGFCSKHDNVGDVVVAFKPEFIHYYITNMETLHE